MVATESLQLKKKSEVLEKLNRIEGRIRGLAKMVDEGRDNEDVLMQISATIEALRVVSKSFVQNHLENCVSGALMATNTEARETRYQEILGFLYKYIR